MIELDRLSGLRNLRTTEDEEMAVTKREAAIISAYTGILLSDFSELHKYAEEKLDRSISTHEFGFMGGEMKAVSRDDFLKINDSIID